MACLCEASLLLRMSWPQVTITRSFTAESRQLHVMEVQIKRAGNIPCNVCGGSVAVNDTALFNGTVAYREAEMESVKAIQFPSQLDPTNADTEFIDDSVISIYRQYTATRTSVAVRNYISIPFPRTYDNISLVIIYAGVIGSVSSSAALSVWLSPTSNFTAGGTKCIEGLSTLQMEGAYVTCPPANATGWLTIERRDRQGRSDSLVLVEARAFYQGELKPRTSSCTDVWPCNR